MFQIHSSINAPHIKRSASSYGSEDSKNHFHSLKRSRLHQRAKHYVEVDSEEMRSLQERNAHNKERKSRQKSVEVSITTATYNDSSFPIVSPLNGNKTWYSNYFHSK